jgi:hypothetical protein
VKRQRKRKCKRVKQIESGEIGAKKPRDSRVNTERGGEE